MMIILLLLCVLLVADGYKGKVIKSFNLTNEEKFVTLTFDDGPHGTLTPKILDILKIKGVKATWFLMGPKVVMHPDIVKRMAVEGHELANHAFNHPRMNRISHNEAYSQLSRTSEAILNASGVNVTMMRPPYGASTEKMNAYITDTLGLDIILFSLVTHDWETRATAASINQRVKDNLQPGAIILCHDTHTRTLLAMSELVDYVHSKGYRFLTVGELLTLKGSA